MSVPPSENSAVHDAGRLREHDKEGAAGFESPIFRRLAEFFSFKSIRNKMIVSLLLFYFFGSLAAVAALYSLSRMEQKISLIESFDQLNQIILETRRNEKNYLLYGNISDLMSALDFLDEVRLSLNTLEDKDAFSNSATAELLPNADTQLEIYAELLQKLSRRDLRPEKLNQLKMNLRQQGHVLTKVLLRIDNLAREEVDREAKNYRRMVLIILVTALLLGGVIAVLLIHWVMGPLSYISNAVAQVKRGELTDIPEAPVSRSCVECADIIRSLNMLFHALEEKQGQLVQSTKLAAIGKVTAGIAHEINNPLNNISLTAEVLLEDLPNIECSERLDMVRDIVVQADRAREVVRHLLVFSRSRKPSSWQRVDLVGLARETTELLKNQIRISQVKLEASLSSEPVTVMGNPNQLQQVLVNIFLNAIQVLEPGGRVFLGVAREEGNAVVTVSDNGPGIPEDIRAQIFDPFFTTKGNGTGLGLSVSYGIIKEHHGDISLSSETGKGTRFRIILPLENTAKGPS